MEEPLNVGDVVAGLFVVYRMALFEHRVLFDVGDAVEDSASSDYDEIQATKEGSATSAVDDPVLMTIGGGGDLEKDDASPPSKRRKRGKGRTKQIARRSKSSRSYEELTVTDAQNVPEESGENETENVTPTASPRLDRKAAWRQSPKGRASSAASSRKYEMSPLGKSTRRRYKTSEEGIEKRRRYESSQERKESKKGHESTTKSSETRRRYRSAEGRLIRAKYGVSEDGRAAIMRAVKKYGNTEHGSESIKRAVQKYGNSEHGRKSIKRALQNFGNTEHGRKSLTKARKKYELKEAAQKRRLRYKQRKAYYQRVRKATKHLIAKAAETEPQRANIENQFDEEPLHSKPGTGNSCTNKEAMATIRSHKVRHIIQDQIVK